MSICSINHKRNRQPLQAIWNVGIRCTYDCSYCPSSRHSLTKDMTSLEDLMKSANFIIDYFKMQNKYLKDVHFCLDVTGGEPTVNPHLETVIRYTRQELEKVSGLLFEISLTTNGWFAKNKYNMVRDCFDTITVSYHAEQNSAQRELVIQNIKDLHQDTISGDYKLEDVRVNVMMHEDPDLFQDCQDVIQELDNFSSEKKVVVRPRTIDRDDSGQSRGRKKTKIKESRFGPTSGKSYTDKQLTEIKKQYTKKYNIDKSIEFKVGKWKEGHNMKQVNGRPCCGGVTMTVENNGSWSDTKMIFDRNFQGWNCLVALEWLYIEQEDDEVFTHQTCKANFNNEKGPIGKISESEKILEMFSNYYNKGQMPVIRCPNVKCSCGICTPKSTSKDTITEFLKLKSDNLIPIFSEEA